MDNAKEFTSEQKINLLEALKKMNEEASKEKIDFKKLQEVATYMSSDCLKPLNLDSITKIEEVVEEPMNLDSTMNVEVETKEEEERKKTSFVPQEETVEEKIRIRELFEGKLEDALVDPAKREEMLNALKEDLDNSFEAVKNSNDLNISYKTVSLYQLFMFTGKLYQTKKSYNYELTQEEEFLLSNYLKTNNQLEEVNHTK